MGYDIQWGAPHQNDCKDNVIVELPDIVWWNFDNFLMTFIREGLEKILNGHTYWTDNERDRLEEARALAAVYLDCGAGSGDVDPAKALDGARRCMAIVGDMLPRLWD